MRYLSPAPALFAILTLGSAGCERGPEPEPVSGADVETDNRRAMDGLSPSQIERRAEPMSPERAAELGIIDSTIHVSQEP